MRLLAIAALLVALACVTRASDNTEIVAKIKDLVAKANAKYAACTDDACKATTKDVQNRLEALLQKVTVDPATTGAPVPTNDVQSLDDKVLATTKRFEELAAKLAAKAASCGSDATCMDKVNALKARLEELRQQAVTGFNSKEKAIVSTTGDVTNAPPVADPVAALTALRAKVDDAKARFDKLIATLQERKDACATDNDCIAKVQALKDKVDALRQQATVQFDAEMKAIVAAGSQTTVGDSTTAEPETTAAPEDTSTPEDIATPEDTATPEDIAAHEDTAAPETIATPEDTAAETLSLETVEDNVVKDEEEFNQLESNLDTKLAECNGDAACIEEVNKLRTEEHDLKQEALGELKGELKKAKKKKYATNKKRTKKTNKKKGAKKGTKKVQINKKKGAKKAYIKKGAKKGTKKVHINKKKYVTPVVKRKLAQDKAAVKRTAARAQRERQEANNIMKLARQEQNEAHRAAAAAKAARAKLLRDERRYAPPKHAPAPAAPKNTPKNTQNRKRGY